MTDDTLKFERYQLFQSKSLAHKLFRRHHTHFNDMYWSQRVAFSHTFSQTRGLKRDDVVTTLFSPTKDEARNSRSLGDWGQWYSEFDSWTRMAYVIALTGYLELYIAQIATAAFESNPSLVLGGGPRIEGAALLKKNKQYDLSLHSEKFTRGDWQARVSAYKKTFHSCPFEGHISDLEKLRKLRNDAGHSFGRDINTMKFAEQWHVEKLTVVSDNRIMGFLKLIETVANKIDEHIAQEHVGQYEILKIYHHWQSTAQHYKKQGRNILSKAFKKHMYALTGDSYGKPSLLIDYYESL